MEILVKLSKDAIKALSRCECRMDGKAVVLDPKCQWHRRGGYI